MKRGVFLVAGFLAVACLSPRLRAQESKDAIVAGERIGQVRLGMDADAVGKILGKPAFGDSHHGRGSDTWIAKSSDGQVEQTQVASQRGEQGNHWNVTQVAVTSPYFRTRGGNSTNSDLDAVWREFPNLSYVDTKTEGKDSDLEIYNDDPSGVAFLIERNKHAHKGEPWGKCRAVIVHPANGGVEWTAVGAPLDQSSGG